MSFPQVVVGDRLLGGFSEVLAAAESGALDDLLAA
jgi:glutaredoxin-related protein